MKFSPAAAPAVLALCIIVSPAIANLRGGGSALVLQDGQPSAIVTEDSDYHASPKDDCTVLAVDQLMIPNEEEAGRRSLHNNNNGNMLEFACAFPDGTIADMSGLDASQILDLEEAMTNGQMVSGDAKLDLGSIPGASRGKSSVTFPPGFNVSKNARRGGKGQGRGGGSGRVAPGRNRKLAQLTGNKYTLVVKGKFNDYPFDAKSAASLSDDVFGTGTDLINMASQLEACSFGKLVTVPGPDPEWNSGAFTSLAGIEAAPGVLEIDMGVNLAGMAKSDIWNKFVEKTKLKLDPSGTVITSLPGPFDHIMFARETCLAGDTDSCGWAAYAYINSWGQMYKAHYISSPGVTIHEMGHNLNLAHSGSNGGIAWTGGSVGSGSYTDHTCLMGNPLYADEDGKMCFNPAKSFQIDGWYNDAKIVLDPAGHAGTPTDATWEGNVLGVGEYNLRGFNEPVTIKIETGTPQDIFVGFNRAAGSNAQNDLADDLVNVIKVEGNDGLGYSQSRLIGLLDTSVYSELSIPDIVDYADLKIKVNSINTDSVPGTANLKIGFDQCTSNQQCQDMVGECFVSSCQAQNSAGANVLGCVNTPIEKCCGNGMCEAGETSGDCAADCFAGPITVQPDDCSSCWIRDGAMFDVEAKPDADLSITVIEYKAYTSLGNVRLYYREGGKAGYASGTNLLSNGWVFVKQVAACGSWKYCAISGLSIDVPRGTKVGLLVAYDNGGDVLYYNTNFGVMEDDYAVVHPGSAVNFNKEGEYANSFHDSLMFSGKVTYAADLTSTGSTQCDVNDDCDDGSFCNGAETCNSGTCESGTAPACTLPNDMCSDALEACVSCLSDGDCDDKEYCNGAETCNAFGHCVAGISPSCSGTTPFCSEALNKCTECLFQDDCDDGVACTVDFCTPETGLCTNSPNHLDCDDGVFCNGAETCDAVTGCQNAADPCTGGTPFCDETLDRCLQCLSNDHCEDDGDRCNGVETCTSGQCVSGNPVVCDDGVGCTVDSCNPLDGVCSYTPSDGLCDDNLFCNGVETCDSINDCQSGTAPDCTGSNGKCSETLDTCVECLSDGDCDEDGLFCNGAEMCNASGKCVAGTAPDCSGSTPFCSEALEQCTECLLAGDCNDGVECTDDSCTEGSCSSIPNDTNCAADQVCDASLGCQNVMTVWACSKWAPTQEEACSAQSNANCERDSTVNCGNGGKKCRKFQCSSTAPPPSPSPPPPGPSCQEGGRCSGKCDECCYGYSGWGGNKTCNR